MTSALREVVKLPNFVFNLYLIGCVMNEMFEDIIYGWSLGACLFTAVKE